MNNGDGMNINRGYMGTEFMLIITVLQTYCLCHLKKTFTAKCIGK